MSLFEQPRFPEKNLLPFQGIVNYHGKIFSASESQRYFEHLLQNIPWKNDEAIIFGKHITTARKVAWYSDSGQPYTYSNVTRPSLLWSPVLLEIKLIIERHTGDAFNSCLLNLYHRGEEGMAWHSDAEKALVKHGSIASVSFGAERKFSFKHKATQETISMLLEHGSLLVMKGETQDHWLHRLPPTKRVQTPRINLTFRQMNHLH